MGADNQGGYIENPNEKDKVITCVDAAIAAGIYVVIDWHDHTAEDHVDQARGFFDEMASRYGNSPNVMYETYNEPLQIPWSTIKNYHEQIVPVIRAHTQNVIILGTRSWSQEVDVAASDPVPGVNLAYTIHFYANTHRGELRARVDTAKARGVAVFATEWGTCNADGNGQLDLPSTNTWLNFFKGHHISDANWAIADKNEACAALAPGASGNGGWSSGQLSASGNFIRSSIRGEGGGGDGDGGGGGGSGCCKFGADCGDCGDDGTGWCHQSASNCAECTGSYDAAAPSPGCGEPTPTPAPTTLAPTPPTPALPPTPAPTGSVVEQHGALRVSGNNIVGSHGSPVLLRGMSMFWSQWMGKYWNADVIRWLAEDWKCTVVRLAMGADNQGGYIENPNEKDKVITCVDAAIAAGIYVVIDWHDHTAEDHVDQARGFFDEMASRYGNSPNVMYETYNEPLQIPWSTIKNYHEQIVPVIRAHTQNVIILGTRSWSQEVDVAASDPVPGVNLAYTIHFYANTHRGELRARVDTAKARGVAVFATEWGTCNADGNGQLDLPSTNTWLNFFKGHHISDANWAIADKNEACAALTPGASGNGGWSSGELSASGNFIRNSIRGDSGGGGGGGGSGCCRFGADCGDCGDDGTGWCHQSASNCAECTGSYDAGAPSPGCR